MSSYEEASNLADTLQFLKNLKDPNNIFLDYNASTKGIFKKSYKFKIYYKYEGNRPNYALLLLNISRFPNPNPRSS